MSREGLFGLRAAALALAAAGALAACGSEEGVKPIVVDVFVSTGENRIEKGSAEPLQAAINDVNAAGGVNGQEMQIWLHDLPPGKALLEAVSLKDQGVRVLFVGPSDLSIPIVQNVTIPSKVFLFANASSSPRLSAELARPAAGYFVRTSLSAEAAAKKLARMAYDRGVRRIGLLYAQDGVGPEYAASFIDAFRAEGGELTGDPPAAQVIPAGPLKASYKKELLDAVEGASVVDGKPAVAVLTSPEAFKVLLRDAQADGLSLQWYGGHTVRERGVLDESPAAAEGMLGVTPGHGRTANHQAYVESFLRYKPDGDPSANWYPHSYDAMVVYALSLARSGGGTPSADKIRSNLRKIANAGIGKQVFGPGQLVDAFRVIKNGGDVDYQGASGALDFGGAGDVIGNWVEYRVEGGKFIVEDN